jgi:hypothetical protein
MFVQIEKVKRSIRMLPFVTKLSPVDTYKDKEAGWGTTLKYDSCPDYCGKRQETPVQLSFFFEKKMKKDYVFSLFFLSFYLSLSLSLYTQFGFFLV